MSQLTQLPATRAKGGGNYIAIVQVDKAADGTFEAHTGTDVFGEAAGSVHIIGSVEETAIAREDSGSWKFDVTLVEQDLLRKNSLNNAAPYSTTASASKEELILEDDTVLESTDGSSDDSTKPYFQIMVFAKPTAAGKEQVFFGIGQFSRAGGWSQKARTYSKLKVTANTVDGNEFECVLPNTTTFPRFTGITAPTLEDNARMGTWVEEA